MISALSTVRPMPASLVLTSGASATTEMLSAMLPTSSTGSTLAVRLTSSTIPVCTNFLKFGALISTR